MTMTELIGNAPSRVWLPFRESSDCELTSVDDVLGRWPVAVNIQVIKETQQGSTYVDGVMPGDDCPVMGLMDASDNFFASAELPDAGVCKRGGRGGGGSFLGDG